MKKKIVSLLFGAVLTAALLSGCAQASSGSTPAAGQAQEEAPAAEEQEEAPAAEEQEEAADNTSEAAEAAGNEEDELAQILSRGKIIVGIEGTYPPFTYHDDNGDLAGYDVDVARSIAEKLGVEVEFVEAAWDSLLIGVDTGKFDTVINCVSITEERQEKYDFTQPYYFTSRQVVVRGDDDSIQSEDDLKGKKIATNLTNAYIDWYESHGAEVVGIDTSGEAAEMLLSGRVDFTSFSEVILADFLKEHPEADLKVAFVIPDSEAQVGIPFRKGETRLVETVNGILDELRSEGKLLELSEKYFEADYTVSVYERQ